MLLHMLGFMWCVYYVMQWHPGTAAETRAQGVRPALDWDMGESFLAFSFCLGLWEP